MPINLYQGKEYFLIRIYGIETFIDEPINWDKVLFKSEQDEEFYGFNAEFIDGDIQLVFAFEDGGGNELEALYETDGADGLAVLEFGLIYNQAREKQFSGNINLNTKNETEVGIECTVERVSFEHAFRTRYTTKVSLNSSTSYDGDYIVGPPSLNLRLHSKNIVKISQAVSLEPSINEQNSNTTTNPASNVHYIQPDTTNIEPDELQEMDGSPMGITNTDPFTDQRYQYKAAEGGFLEIFYSWYMQGGPYYLSTGGQPVITSDIDGTWANNVGGPVHDYQMFVWVERAGALVSQQFKPAVSNKFPIPNTFYIDVQKDDQIYVGIKVTHANNVQGWYTDTYVNTINFKQYTIAPPSNCIAYKVIDFLNHLVATITGKTNRVISEYFGPGGAGEHLAITSGYAIRKFDVSIDKPIQCDASTAFESLAAIKNIGIGFKTVPDPITGDEEEYIFVEPQPYFFKRGIIATISEAYEWNGGHDKDRTFNQVLIGYQTYADKELNTLDEFNTEQELLLPVKTYKNTLTKKSDFIASGYSIEIHRREQFKENPSTSLSNDDKLFIIAYTETVEYPGVGYTLDATNQTISFSKAVGLTVGDTFLLQDLGHSYTVTDIDFLGINSYKITGFTFPTQPGTDTLIITHADNADGTQSNAFAERNQYFEKVTNVIDPASCYNLRITPHRNLYNFAPLLNIGMEKKDGGLYLNKTFAKNNGDLVTKMMVGAPNLGPEGTREIIEKASILLADFNRSSKVCSGSMMSFKSRLSYDVVKIIRQAMRDELQDAEKNCGCIVAPDRSGKMWICRIKSMSYNYVTEEATFVTNKVELY